MRNIKGFVLPLKLHYGLITSTLDHAICHYTKYETIIFWCEEDNAYVAGLLQLQGSMVHGDTYESALDRNCKRAWRTNPRTQRTSLMYA